MSGWRFFYKCLSYMLNTCRKKLNSLNVSVKLLIFANKKKRDNHKHPKHPGQTIPQFLKSRWTFRMVLSSSTRGMSRTWTPFTSTNSCPAWSNASSTKQLTNWRKRCYFSAVVYRPFLIDLAIISCPWSCGSWILNIIISLKVATLMLNTQADIHPLGLAGDV